MKRTVHSNDHIPCGYLGVLECNGYQNTDKVICMTAIVEGSILFIDTKSKFQQGLLNVFKYKSNISPQYKLSKNRVAGTTFCGKVLMAINQY